MPPPLDIGKLLRLQGMVTAAQVEITKRAGTALVGAYTGLAAEIREMLEGDGLDDLRAEFNRLFMPIESPAPMNDRSQEMAATAALVKLKQAAGWIQGLIDEITLEQRLRMEAQERAKIVPKPTTGFGA